MRGADIKTYSDILLRPDPARTVIRPFAPEDPIGFVVPGHPRAGRIVARVLGMTGEQLARDRRRATDSLDERHRDVDAVLMRRFEQVAKQLALDPLAIDRPRALLIGAYFCAEYSFEAAALFNPSIVPHPDQSGLADGALRFILSLRGIGEGHVSSVTFRTGTWRPGRMPNMDPVSPTAVSPIIEQRGDDGGATTIRIDCGGSRDVSESVLFPITPSQQQGIEDLRLVQFTEQDGTQCYYGTYTAFSGAAARSELLSSSDFRSFEMRALHGDATRGKGMALFPRRVNGRYAMLGRHDNENIWLLESDDLYTWNAGRRIVMPYYPWEFVQLGNCGSPIEIEEGWLVLTHGVGTVRNYCIGACLLDRDDPSRVLARTPLPLIHPSAKERDGYVPNVVYSCGALVRERTLLLPYGVADDFATFATVGLDDLLAVMA
ncbi:glycoside hydrolase family 130 protein [Sphingomonas qilianensis]|uniref:Glycoside hydrolase family 130 protein n=1 Tax=Sphingomonas qilianensis TaxID=1736690 RepID=A0ABU9XNH6_9SPHN